MKSSTILFLFVLLMTSCGPSVRTVVVQPYSDRISPQEVVVLGLVDELPVNRKTVGTIKIGDTGFSTKCSWEEVVGRAKLEASKVGANVVKITSHQTPSAFGSSCHRIEAQMLYVNDMDVSPREDVVHDWDYAKLYVYRSSGSGFLVSYALNLNDKYLCDIGTNTSREFRLREEGLHTLWARTESRTEVDFNLELGREYYLRCGVSVGLVVGRPTLEFVDPEMGRIEYLTIQNK